MYTRGVKLNFIQGPQTDQFDLMWAGSLKRWKEGRKKGRKSEGKVGKTDIEGRKEKRTVWRKEGK